MPDARRGAASAFAAAAVALTAGAGPAAADTLQVPNPVTYALTATDLVRLAPPIGLR